MAAGPGPPPAEEEEAAAAAAAEAEAASRSAGHELGRCGRCPSARKRPLESGCSRRLVTQSELLVGTQRIPTASGPTAARRAPRMRTHALERKEETTHPRLSVPKDLSAAEGGAAIACTPGNVALAPEWRQGYVEVG